MVEDLDSKNNFSNEPTKGLEAVLVSRQKTPVALEFGKPLSGLNKMLLDYFDKAYSVYMGDACNNFRYVQGVAQIIRSPLSPEQREDYRLHFLNRWQVDLENYLDFRKKLLDRNAQK